MAEVAHTYSGVADVTPEINRGADGAPVHGTLPNKNFYFQAPVGAFTRLLHGMEELLKRMVVRVDETGLHVCERRAQNNMLLFVNIPASKLEKFTTEGESLVRFEPDFMYRCIKSAEQGDTMFWQFDKKTPAQMIVGVMRRGEKAFVSEFVVKILVCTSSTYSAPPTEVDYYLGINSTIFINYINVLVMIKNQFPDDYVTISCDQNEISISREGGLMIPNAKFVLGQGRNSQDGKHPKKRRRRKNDNEVTDTTDPDYPVRVVQRPVKNRYKLEHLHHLVKCFAMDEVITVYIRRDFPLIFHVDVGDIGSFRAVLMFAEDDEET